MKSLSVYHMTHVSNIGTVRTHTMMVKVLNSNTLVDDTFQPSLSYSITEIYLFTSRRREAHIKAAKAVEGFCFKHEGKT